MTHTVSQLLSQATKSLTQSTSARLDAEVLLAKTLGKSRTYLYAHPETAVQEKSTNEFSQWIKRRQHGEPLAYITGQKEFWSMTLMVNSATLIPRPETELMVEQALTYIPHDECTIADLGTGSGAIALAIAHERPNATIIAADICQHALTVAINNASKHKLKNIHFVQANWLQGLKTTKFDVILANPPYIAENDPDLDTESTLYEPQHALIAHDHGIASLAHIITHAAEHLKPAGWLLVEHGFKQGQQVTQLFEQHAYRNISLHQDYAHKDRFTCGQST